MKNEHTPTPWTNGIGPCGITGPNTPSCSGVTCGEHIDILNWKPGDPHPKSQHIPITKGMDTIAICVGLNREENAALITRAANTHDELLAALKLALDRMEAEGVPDFSEAMVNARAAIAKAEAQ